MLVICSSVPDAIRSDGGCTYFDECQHLQVEVVESGSLGPQCRWKIR